MGVLATHDEAPDFTMPLFGGGHVTLSTRLAAGPLLLYFYKTECPTSALVLPVIHRLAERTQVVAIAQNEADEVSEFLARQRLAQPVSPPSDGRFAPVSAFWAQPVAAKAAPAFDYALEPAPYATSDAFGVVFTPTAFLIDTDRRVAASAEAWSRDDYNSLAAALAAISGQPSFTVSLPDDGLPPRAYG